VYFQTSNGLDDMVRARGLCHVRGRHVLRRVLGYDIVLRGVLHNDTLHVLLHVFRIRTRGLLRDRLPLPSDNAIHSGNVCVDVGGNMGCKSIVPFRGKKIL